MPQVVEEKAGPFGQRSLMSGRWLRPGQVRAQEAVCLPGFASCRGFRLTSRGRDAEAARLCINGDLTVGEGNDAVRQRVCHRLGGDVGCTLAHGVDESMPEEASQQPIG